MLTFVSTTNWLKLQSRLMRWSMIIFFWNSRKTDPHGVAVMVLVVVVVEKTCCLTEFLRYPKLWRSGYQVFLPQTPRRHNRFTSPLNTYLLHKLVVIDAALWWIGVHVGLHWGLHKLGETELQPCVLRHASLMIKEYRCKEMWVKQEIPNKKANAQSGKQKKELHQVNSYV